MLVVTKLKQFPVHHLQEYIRSVWSKGCAELHLCLDQVLDSFNCLGTLRYQRSNDKGAVIRIRQVDQDNQRKYRDSSRVVEREWIRVLLTHITDCPHDRTKSGTIRMQVLPKRLLRFVENQKANDQQDSCTQCQPDGPLKWDQILEVTSRVLRVTKEKFKPRPPSKCGREVGGIHPGQGEPIRSNSYECSSRFQQF